MPEVDYGGIRVNWTPSELAKIEEYRSWATARRVLGISNNGHSIQQFTKNKANTEALRRLAKEVYRDIKGA